MGGSGSNAGRPQSGSGGAGKKDRCDITFQTDLFSPVAEVIDRLESGDFLDIQLYMENNVTSVAALTQDNGDVAGTITAVGQLGDLVACLRAGELYEAEIIKKSGSTVTVVVNRV